MSIFSSLNFLKISSCEFFLVTVSTSILIVDALGNNLFISCSSFCVPVPKYLIFVLLHSGQMLTGLSVCPQ